MSSAIGSASSNPQVSGAPPPFPSRDTKSTGSVNKDLSVDGQGNSPDPLNSTPKATLDKVSMQVPANPRMAVSTIQQELWNSEDAQGIRRQMEDSREVGVKGKDIFDSLQGTTKDDPNWKLQNGRFYFAGGGDKISEAYLFINRDGKLDFFIAGENGKSAIKGAKQFKEAAGALLKKANISTEGKGPGSAINVIKPETFEYQSNLPLNTCRIMFFDPQTGNESAWIRVNNGGVEFGGPRFGLGNGSVHETYENVFKIQPGGVHYNNHPYIFSSIIEYLKPGTTSQHTVIQSGLPEKEDQDIEPFEPTEIEKQQVLEDENDVVIASEQEPEQLEAGLAKEIRELEDIQSFLSNISESTTPQQLEAELQKATGLVEEMQKKTVQLISMEAGGREGSSMLEAAQEILNAMQLLFTDLDEKLETGKVSEEVSAKRVVLEGIFPKDNNARQSLLISARKFADALINLEESVKLLTNESMAQEAQGLGKVREQISSADQSWQTIINDLKLDKQDMLKANKDWSDFTEKIPQREKLESLQNFQNYLDALSGPEKNQATQAWREFIDGLPQRAKFAAIKASNIFSR